VCACVDISPELGQGDKLVGRSCSSFSRFCSVPMENNINCENIDNNKYNPSVCVSLEDVKYSTAQHSLRIDERSLVVTIPF